ncbi:hypothetical protein L227DRAFT_594628 [Lentinus tigrinus ALCF2SS1-6]|uniref:Protein kinase domain-containing protein n=1 Tax=Lentinus tigrinus ALCF2SS1-6 TaxID=1328759 RepID=A0A5C2S3Q4_9APHY|nr:hypothetical protein L227DRAFT_594628 [Lentinus tigrinus ALCF2SS1-6]
MPATANVYRCQNPPSKSELSTPEKHEPGSLYSFEIFWRDHQKWLQERGYMLRPRFREDWVPSWKGTKDNPKKYEDGHTNFVSQIMDARRMSDGAVVILKLVKHSINPYEVDISTMFSTEPLASDPRNHCVPVYETLNSPLNEDDMFLVIPFLRRYNAPRFYTVGEAVECFRQLIEGLQFMHQNCVAHRDIMTLNVMMDPLPLVSEVYHPILDAWNYDTNRRVKFSIRTGSPTKYYYIDFGLSRKYPDDCTSPLEVPIIGGDKTVPEFQNSDEACNPFPTDVYYLGNLIRTDFIQRYRNFDFMEPLVDDMVQDDPSKRPTIDQVVDRFDKICSTLSAWRLRSRLTGRKDSNIVGFFRTFRHAYRTLTFVITRTPALPSPP